MPYSTLASLTDRYGEAPLVALTDRGPVPLGVVDMAVVNRALADADAVIDGYLGVRYALPLVTIPPLIADLAATISFWKLHVYEPDPKLKADYDAAMRSLRDIAQGLIRIPAAGVEPATPDGNDVYFTEPERPMTAEKMKGFI